VEVVDSANNPIEDVLHLLHRQRHLGEGVNLKLVVAKDWVCAREELKVVTDKWEAKKEAIKWRNWQRMVMG